MIYAILSQTVEDFKTWKPVFESDQPRAAAAGIECVKLLRSLENPNEISVLFSAPSSDALHRFFSDPILPVLMKRAGVVSLPTLEIFGEA